jgi:hypothetical protein
MSFNNATLEESNAVPMEEGEELSQQSNADPIDLKYKSVPVYEMTNSNPIDNSAFTTILPGAEIDFYLWVSHGSTVSSIQNYYPVETKFRSMVFYGKPFKITTEIEIIKMFTEDPCRLLTGTCPVMPIDDGKKKYSYLPPIVFFLNTNDTIQLQTLIGLY